ncbi:MULTISPECIES: 3-deoxy-D-manno-octulosonic acid transferase [Polaromonas]|uniref:3-deoxy-D-manno-octulosonic acid transferase n=1 Tax=Polaromonas aquatica TaxID=332657 RepID=A0ABW1TU83_9BURK
MNRIILSLYSLLMWVAQPFLRGKLARRSLQEPGYGEAVQERFGHYSQPEEAQADLVWVHAVSLGETRTAALLVKALRAEHPGLRILLTSGTATGRAEGESLLREGDIHIWQPWDSAAAVARFFDHFKPRLGLLMETEVWPNLVAAAGARAVPLVLVNGRLSEKSLRKALAISPLSYPAFGALAAVYAQTGDDAKRFRQLGVDVAGVFGNLKFDARPDMDQQATGKAWRQALARQVVMFASSREGEEGAFFKEISATAQQRRATPAIDVIAADIFPPKFLIVPRHPQRFDEVQALAEQHGLRVSRRSGWAAGPADSEEAMSADVWLGDSLGEMALYYALSDVALLGGSFEPLGGQNLIEAAACGCPVVMGLHTFNFTEAADLAEAAGAARRVADMPEAVHTSLVLLARPDAHQAAVAASFAFTAGNRGATQKTLAALRPLLRR